MQVVAADQHLNSLDIIYLNYGIDIKYRSLLSMPIIVTLKSFTLRTDVSFWRIPPIRQYLYT